MSEAQDSPVPGRATIREIARAAGVSTATVDRTLNNRSGVKARTRNQVLDAAVRLGYLPEHRVAAPGPAAGAVTIDFVLPGGTNTFLKLLSEHLGAIAEARRSEAEVRVHHIEGFNPEALGAYPPRPQGRRERHRRAAARPSGRCARRSARWSPAACRC